MILHHTGGHWTFVDPGDIGTGAAPRAVAGSRHLLLVAGSKASPSGPSFSAPLTASFDGSLWQGESPDVNGYMTGVALVDGEGWAVGSTSGKPLILHRSST
jgi:hypothetical protein